MRLFTLKCPVEAEDKAWIEDSMLWLVEEFGADTLRNAAVVLPTHEFFPDQFSEGEDDMQALVSRVCGYMGVDPERVELNIFTNEDVGTQRRLPSYEYSHSGAVGHYRKHRGKFVIS